MKMAENPERHKEESEFFEGEYYEPASQQPESEPEWLKKRREWLRSLTQEDRDYIAQYGIELWEQKTGRKRYV
jgi:hypothetical protein